MGERGSVCVWKCMRGRMHSSQAVTITITRMLIIKGDYDGDDDDTVSSTTIMPLSYHPGLAPGSREYTQTWPDLPIVFYQPGNSINTSHFLLTDWQI